MTDRDRTSYLDTLQEFRIELGIKVYGYCLMTNHVHLIIDLGNNAANLHLLMKRLACRHTRRINRLERRTGTSWEGRFKCSPIGSDRYLLACTRYVDLNPVRARMVAAPENYPWSSHQAHIGLSECDWLDADPCYLALAQTAARYNATSSPVSEAFIFEIEQRTGTRILHRQRGRPA